MCDTFVALADSTADRSVILGKNSDREPNEAHELLMTPAEDHPDGATLRCTYISVPQVRRTHAVLLAKPYWIWGAEMGVNDQGVAIGNEAVFTKADNERQPGLLGMDLLRLGLERGATAREAIDVIVTALAAHGQGGQAGHTHNLRYDNSFIAADHGEAWILETVGRDWVAREVSHTDSISNAITTTTDWDLASPGLRHAGVDIAKTHSDFLYTRFSDSAARQCRTSDSLIARRGSITVSDAMTLLRDHGPGAGPDWTPARAVAGQDVCAHAGFGPIRVSQTTGSMVAHLSADGPTVWLTGTSAPCTSVFKPVWFDTGLPDLGPAPGRSFDPMSLWWRHELLHRATLRDYPAAIATYRVPMRALQESLLARAASVVDRRERDDLTREAFTLTADAEARWVTALPTTATTGLAGRILSLPYQRAWEGFNKEAGMPSHA